MVAQHLQREPPAQWSEDRAAIGHMLDQAESRELFHHPRCGARRDAEALGQRRRGDGLFASVLERIDCLRVVLDGVRGFDVDCSGGPFHVSGGGVGHWLYPKNACCSRNRLSEMIMAASTAAIAVSQPGFARAPITSRRRAISSSGTRANGMPNDSTTWLNTSALLGLT